VIFGALAVASVAALAIIPVACSSGGVGDPCTPEDEYDSSFPGFTVDLQNIESRSFQCATRICLVNHFQGRVSCPLGQAAPQGCDPKGTGTPCAAGKTCTQAQIYAPSCAVCNENDPSCTPIPCPTVGSTALNCTSLSSFKDCTESDNGNCTCTCTDSDNSSINGVSYSCEGATNDPTSPLVLHSYVCHETGSCQDANDGATTKNEGKDCCVPGTDSPVAVQVCGQCSASTQRDAAQAVYCSCRCCAPCCSDMTLTATEAANQGCSTDASTCGPACDPNFNYCSCPSGFTCAAIRPNVGLGDAQLAGAYCIQTGTAYTGSASQCSSLTGYAGAESGDCVGSPQAPSASQ
jgi:hypothetical protein